MDAWQALERLDGWRVEWVRNPRYRGLTHFQLRIIQIDADLTRRAERGVLAHEVIHAQAGRLVYRTRPQGHPRAGGEMLVAVHTLSPPRRPLVESNETPHSGGGAEVTGCARGMREVCTVMNHRHSTG